MKKSADIIGLPVIDISEGNEIGTVTKLVINPAEGSVTALVIDDGKWYLGAKLLPFTAIAGLGESAITIINSSAILTIEKAPALEQLLRTNVAIIGTNVLTKAGRLQGTVKEIYINITGKIDACEIEEIDGEISNIPVESIMTFGKKVLIINDETDSITSSSNSKKLTLPETNVNSIKGNTDDDITKLTDEKQRKYLLGKQASRRIETNNGVVIVEQGAEISEEVLQKAKLAGKFVELTMNIE